MTHQEDIQYIWAFIWILRHDLQYVYKYRAAASRVTLFMKEHSGVTHHGVVRHLDAQVAVAVSVLEDNSDLETTTTTQQPVVNLSSS